MNYILDFRLSSVGGAVVPGRVISVAGPDAQFGTEDDLRLETKVTFLVHGYNVNRTNGKAALLRLANALQTAQHEQAIVFVLWPGDHGVLGPASYPWEGKDADDTASELIQFIEMTLPPAVQLSFVSHSLGARVVLKTLAGLNTHYAVQYVCLMAPAVDDFSLADPIYYRAAVSRASRVAVLASHKDTVLRDLYPIADLFQSFLFAKESSGRALGYHGPKNADHHAIPQQVYHVQISDAHRVNHGDYIPDELPTTSQLAAANFADAILQGVLTPSYL